VACDHYRRWRGDVALMKGLGLKAYRFSIAWPRVLPQGVGRINAKGMSFCSKLVDELLAANITPMITLFHWDYPQALWDRGGLMTRDSAEWFGEYADKVFRALGDRVRLWLTLNEPEVFTDCGFRKGVHAPGLKDWKAMIVAGHNLMRGHGLAVQALRAACPKGKIGVAYALGPNLPDKDTPEDRDCARRNGAYSRRICDPILLGEYPPRFEKMFAGMMPKGYEADLPLISQKTDLIGVNYYSKWHITYDPSVPYLQSKGALAWDHKEGGAIAQSGFFKGKTPTRSKRGVRLSPHGWEILPEGLYETLRWARNRFGNHEFFVTENGTAGNDDLFTRDEELHDSYRIEYLRGHLQFAHRAIQEGLKLRGYMQWSLLDNLEWAAGYRIRCGMTYTDFKTQQRTFKDSARWYQQVIAKNAVERQS
jgi:beta-glucosidase